MAFPLSATEIDQIASGAPQAVAQHLVTTFDAAAAVESDATRQAALQLVASVLRLGRFFRPANTAHPFGKPEGQNTHEVFSQEDATILADLSAQIKTAEIRALMADIAWLRKRRDPNIARRAVEAYIESARATEIAGHWPDTIARMERALRLGCSLGRNDIAFEAAKTYALDAVHKYRGEDSLFLTAKIVELLMEFRVGTPLDYENYVQYAAHKARNNKNYLVSQNYFELLIRIRQKSGDNISQIAALRELAKAFELQADDFESSNNFMGAAHFLTHAIQVHRRAPDSNTEIERVRLNLQRVERLSTNQMKRIQSDPIDISAETEKARNCVTGYELGTALLRFSYIVPLANYEDMHRQAASAVKNSIARKIASISHVDSEGRVIGQERNEKGEEISFSDLVEQYSHYRRFIVQAYILPALDQIIQEHNITLEAIFTFSKFSPFVPEDREMIFSKGLLAGFDLDMIVSVNLIVPQIENSIRYLMNSKGMIITKLDQYGVQRLHDLSELLIDNRLKKILSNDIIIELRTLLVDNRGPNLRHQLAHGTVCDNSFMSAEVIYAWWLVLNLCVFGKRVRANEAPVKKSEEE